MAVFRHVLTVMAGFWPVLTYGRVLAYSDLWQGSDCYGHYIGRVLTVMVIMAVVLACSDRYGRVLAYSDQSIWQGFWHVLTTGCDSSVISRRVGARIFIENFVFQSLFTCKWNLKCCIKIHDMYRAASPFGIFCWALSYCIPVFSLPESNFTLQATKWQF